MDNDRTGKQESIWLRDNYDIIPILIPKEIGAKDFAELVSKQNIETVNCLINRAIKYAKEYNRKDNKLTRNKEEHDALPY